MDFWRPHRSAPPPARRRWGPATGPWGARGTFRHGADGTACKLRRRRTVPQDAHCDMVWQTRSADLPELAPDRSGRAPESRLGAAIAKRTANRCTPGYRPPEEAPAA